MGSDEPPISREVASNETGRGVDYRIIAGRANQGPFISKEFVLFCSFQQLPPHSLGPLIDFLSYCDALQGLSTLPRALELRTEIQEHCPF